MQEEFVILLNKLKCVQGQLQALEYLKKLEEFPLRQASYAIYGACHDTLLKQTDQLAEDLGFRIDELFAKYLSGIFRDMINGIANNTIKPVGNMINLVSTIITSMENGGELQLIANSVKFWLTVEDLDSVITEKTRDEGRSVIYYQNPDEDEYSDGPCISQ